MKRILFTRKELKAYTRWQVGASIRGFYQTDDDIKKFLHLKKTKQL